MNASKKGSLVKKGLSALIGVHLRLIGIVVKSSGFGDQVFGLPAKAPRKSSHWKFRAVALLYG